MKITPLEIRQKTFEKVFRGFDKDEVTAFLQILSEEWEKMQDEKKELVIKLESAEKEITKLREVENSLYKTLKTAEDTGASMIEQANKAAELQLKETKMKADNIMMEAKAKGKLILENTEKRAREIIENMLTEIKTLEQNYNAALALKENLISDLINLSSSTLERAEKFKAKKEKMDVDKYIKQAREFAENYDLKNFKFDEEEIRENMKAEDIRMPKEDDNRDTSKEDDNQEKSFFDLID